MTIATPERQLVTIEFRVFGLPGPQGSKSFKGYKNGRGIMAESSQKVKPWRYAIQATADDCYSGEPLTGPVRVEIDFFFARPKSCPCFVAPVAKFHVCFSVKSKHGTKYVEALCALNSS